jgi:hypothetical protein
MMKLADAGKSSLAVQRFDRIAIRTDRRSTGQPLKRRHIPSQNDEHALGKPINTATTLLVLHQNSSGRPPGIALPFAPTSINVPMPMP